MPQPRGKHASRNTAAFDSPDAIEVELKDPWLAALLAWLIPGLGHLYQGRTGKGILFLICILGTFLYGFYLGDGRVVYASTPSLFTRWQYFCQLGVGLSALPAIIQRGHVKKDPLAEDTIQDLMRPPTPPRSRVQPFVSVDGSGNEVVHPDELAKWHHDLADRFELGTVFTVIAGLLNVLAIYDAYGGPLVITPREKSGRVQPPDSD